MAVFFSLIAAMILGFLMLVFIDTGPLRGLAALLLITPPFLIALLLGNYLMNKQLHKHVRGRYRR